MKSGEKVWDRVIDRTISSCAVLDGRVYVADLTGYVYGLDEATGEMLWRYDTMGLIWASPLVADGKLYIGNDGGEMIVFSTEMMEKLSTKYGRGINIRIRQDNLDIKLKDGTKNRIPKAEAKKYVSRIQFLDPIFSSTVVARGVLYVASKTRLYAISSGGR